MLLRLVDRAFLLARSMPFCYRFALFTRILLAAGFIPTGMVKLLGQRFTLISPENPIGAFFEAMYQTGGYWRFLGATQVLAGLLLLIPRVAHLGAAIFLGIITNIFVITVALQFTGTWIVTGLMLLAVVYLCMWDFHRFRPMLTEAPPLADIPQHRLDGLERIGFGLFALTVLSFFGLARVLLPRGFAAGMIGLGVAAGLFTLGRFVWITATGRARRLVDVAPATA